MKDEQIVTVTINNVDSFRKIYEARGGNGALYGASVSVLDLFKVREQIDATLGINPRNQKDTSRPSRAMEETLNDASNMFVFRNRGITFIAKDVRWDNSTHDLVMTFVISGKKEDEVNGLADGGHTYNVLMRYIDQIDPSERHEIDAYVRLDILTGFNEYPEEVGMIVESRNTSTQVREESILNRDGYFEPLKNALAGTKYADQIAYYENQLVNDDDPEKGYRPIKVSTVLSYLMCFDPNTFDSNSHPTIAYSSKKKAVDWYVKFFDSDHKNKTNDLQNFMSLAPAILDFHDYIESQVPKVWNMISGRYADQPGVKTLNKESSLPFGPYKTAYAVPGGHVYPVLSAFRSVVDSSGGNYTFKADLKKLFDQMNSGKQSSLIHKLVATDKKDPQTMGKSNDLYTICYMSVTSYYLENK